LQICEDIHSSRCTTGVVDTSGKWKKSTNQKILIFFEYLSQHIDTLFSPTSLSVVSSLILLSFFATGVVDTDGKVPLMSLTPAANLAPASKILAVSLANLLMVSLTPVVHLDLRISPRIFEKIPNDPSVPFRDLEEGDS
jgi:hypothetical protein